MGIKILRMRHLQPPTPESCRWCGWMRREHASQWVPGQGWHEYTTPTITQIAARARARRNFQMSDSTANAERTQL